MQNGRRATVAALVLGLLLGGGFTFANAQIAQAAACPKPKVDIGSVKLSVSVPTDAQYTIWTRMAVPNSKDSYVGLEVDGTSCYVVGGPGQTTVKAWKWVKYDAGTKKDIVKTLSAGSHSLKYIGASAGVVLDKVILTPDGCVPEGKGDNCPAGDAKGPDVDVVSPTSNSSGSGSITIKVAASDANGIKEVQFLVDGKVVSTDSTAPYTYTWNSADGVNGLHNLTVKAIDKAGNSSTSDTVPVTTTGGGKFKKGDVNQDGTVNTKDLSAIMRNWGKAGSDPAGTDTNGDQKVDIKDLSNVVSDWAK